MGMSDIIMRPNRRHVLGWAWASLVANTVIVLTGGTVRLTASGLGCPTWPRCTEDSFVPRGELGLHGVIEFGNRLLTYVLVAVAIGTLVAVWRWSAGGGAGPWAADRAARALRLLVVLLAAGIPAQALIGGITVLTNLNPWIVALHLIVSMALIAGSTVLLMRVRGTTPGPVGAGVRRLALATYAVLWVAVYLGTVVTGSGPHAGDVDSPRNGLDPQLWSHVHAASVYVLIALTVATCVAARRTPVAHAAMWLLVAEVAQGLIGFVQYVNDLPIVLVAAHLVGAGVLIALGTRLLLTAASGSRSTHGHRHHDAATS
ncbi:heme A synthase [Aeromicrobium sp. CTD01-1L150]|uniref:COX15/CtaA family protein n=1 Tax=Aeromicrobium sp. CTD01-1L150 TaxID=3341830 RepID=UPI0035C1FAA2